MVASGRTIKSVGHCATIRDALCAALQIEIYMAGYGMVALMMTKCGAFTKYPFEHALIYKLYIVLVYIIPYVKRCIINIYTRFMYGPHRFFADAINKLSDGSDGRRRRRRQPVMGSSIAPANL